MGVGEEKGAVLGVAPSCHCSPFEAKRYYGRGSEKNNPRGYAAPNRFEFRSALMPRSLKQSQKSRHDPLLRDIAADDLYEKYGNVSKPGRRKKTQRANGHDEDGGAEVTISTRVPIGCIAYSHSISQTILDPKTSRRIFELARDQQDELDPPEDEEDEEVIEDDFTRPRTRDLEQLVDDDDDDEGEDDRFQGLSGEEEREFVRRLLGCIKFF